jgi:hypothetical protein
MYALSVQKLPEGKEWLYEVKFERLPDITIRRVWSVLDSVNGTVC